MLNQSKEEMQEYNLSCSSASLISLSDKTEKAQSFRLWAFRNSLKLLNNLAERTGLEPATPGVTGRYSNQLNYHSAVVVAFA
jgi:hypothetical protein